MKTAMQELIEDITIEKRLGYITENAANRILDYINNLYLEQEKEQMIGFYKWMLKTDTADNAEEFFHYTDEDMLEQYLNGDWGPGWRDLSEPLEGEPQDTIPAICEYSGLRPVEGYKEEKTIDSILEIEETEEEAAYRKGYMDGYDEGLYDGMYK